MTAMQLTERESQFVATAFQCMNDKPNIDYAKFAAITGLKGSKSARDSFTPLLKKLMAHGGGLDQKHGGGESREKSPSTPAKASKPARKRKSPTDTGTKSASKGGKRQRKSDDVVKDDLEADVEGSVADLDDTVKKEKSVELDNEELDDAEI